MAARQDWLLKMAKDIQKISNAVGIIASAVQNGQPVYPDTLGLIAQDMEEIFASYEGWGESPPSGTARRFGKWDE